MRIMKLFVAVAVLMLAGAAHAVTDCELNGEPINTANGNTTKGKTGLIRCKDRDTGVLQREQELKDGNFMGLVRFYRQGQLEQEHRVNERGNRDGLSREFYPNGKVKSEETYENGSTVGLRRTFSPEGALRRASFHAPQASEVASAEFTDAGQLSDLRCSDKPVLAPAFDDAKACGFGGSATTELFSSKGVLKARVRHDNGRRVRNESLHESGKTARLDEVTGSVRTEQQFSPEGVKRREVTWQLAEPGVLRGALRTREQEFSATGTLTRDKRWAAGEAVSDDEYYLNGQLRRKTAYSGELRNRVEQVSEFHDNGQLAREGRYARTGRYGNAPVGVHKMYDDKGRPAAEMHYDEQGRITRERAFNEAGQVVRDDAVFEDGSRKAFAK
jgi:antitoxin component YwqK of YwqJK toxin-antitoxin module